MTATTVVKDAETRTMTATATFAAPVERVWQVWADPRQLERWWGPPTYPASVVTHELTAGGMVRYYMTGPDGERHHGYWRILGVDAPRRLEFEDGFADEDGRPTAELPQTSVVVRLDEDDAGGTRMEICSTFASVADMDQLISMGMEEGMRAALGQIDDLLVPAG